MRHLLAAASLTGLALLSGYVPGPAHGPQDGLVRAIGRQYYSLQQAVFAQEEPMPSPDYLSSQPAYRPPAEPVVDPGPVPSPSQVGVPGVEAAGNQRSPGTKQHTPVAVPVPTPVPASIKAQPVPHYDARAACKRRSASRDAEVIKMCVNHENTSMNALQTYWAPASEQRKADCLSRITNETLPYQSLLTCVLGENRSP